MLTLDTQTASTPVPSGITLGTPESGSDSYCDSGNRLPHSCGRCARRWSGQAMCHCSACHETFSSVSSFDSHRSRGECLDPSKIKKLARKESASGVVWISAGERWLPDVVGV